MRDAVNEAVENAMRSDIDRRIIKNVNLDSDRVMSILSKLIGSFADSNLAIYEKKPA